MAVSARAFSRTSSGTVAVQQLCSVNAHFTTMAATDTITLTKSTDGGLLAKLQPAANNQSVSINFPVPVKVNDAVTSDVVQVNFNGTAAGTVIVTGF